MFEVKVFDGQGKLKEVISSKEVSRRYDETFFKSQKSLSRGLTFKKYKCVECKTPFESNSSRGAKYCKDCRKGVYKSRKRRAVSN